MLDFTRTREDMDVYDMDGDKVGSVVEVRTTSGVTTTSGMGTSSGPEVAFKVETAFLGLGKDLYIPFSWEGSGTSLPSQRVRTGCS